MMRQEIRIVRTECISPPGTKVWRDTPIIRGAKATNRGIIIIFLSTIILACGILIAVIPYRLVKSIGEHVIPVTKTSRSLAGIIRWNSFLQD